MIFLLSKPLIIVIVLRPIEITAIIQRPSAYLSPVELDFSESFLNVPIVRYIEIYAVNALPTHFRWGEVRTIDCMTNIPI